MKRSIIFSASLVLAACAPTADKTESQPQSAAPRIGMANPASVYCVEKGGRVEIVTGKDGGQSGLCHLPDGTKIEEWALYRRDHP